VQGIGRVAPENLDQAQANPSLQLFTSALPQHTLIYLNLTSETAPFFSEREIRQALLYALDRQALIDQVLDGQAIVAHSPVLPDSWAYDSTVPTYEYNPEKAISLLQEAGWQATGLDTSASLTGTETLTPTVGSWFKEGRSLSFSLLVHDNPSRIAVAQEVARQWGRLGIRVNVEPVAAGLLSERLMPRHYQAALVDLDLTLSGDPDPYPLWHQTQINGGQNYGGWDNREASEALEQARYLTDRKERKSYYDHFQRVFVKETPALIIPIRLIPTPSTRLCTTSKLALWSTHLNASAAFPTGISTPVASSSQRPRTLNPCSTHPSFSPADPFPSSGHIFPLKFTQNH